MSDVFRANTIVHTFGLKKELKDMERLSFSVMCRMFTAVSCGPEDIKVPMIPVPAEQKDGPVTDRDTSEGFTPPPCSVRGTISKPERKPGRRERDREADENRTMTSFQEAAGQSSAPKTVQRNQARAQRLCFG